MSSDAKPAYDPADLLLFQIVHDVRALVRKGHTRGQMLEAQIGDLCDEKGRALFEEIFSAQRELDQLMLRLAAYAEAGRSGSHEWVKLDTVILGVKLHLKKRLEEAGARVTSMNTDGVRVPAALQGVLTELVSNSIQFRDPSRPLGIMISTSRDGAPGSSRSNAAPSETRRVIRVGDNGRGWNPQYSEKMFEPLRKLEATHDGFGLGLAIARRAVERFGGKIRAEAGAAGGVFMIEFPEDDDSAVEA